LFLSIILEEFPGALPSQIDDEPLIPLMRIVEARQYTRGIQADEAHAAAVRSGSAKAEDAPTGPVHELIDEILSERLRLADDNR